MGEWTEDWVTALRSMPPIERDREVTVDTQRGSYSYKYATLANVIDTVRAVLSDYEFAFAQSVTTVEDRIAVATIFYHSSGERIEFGPLELPAGSTPQAAGSAITYARRYALTAALGLATEDDDDGAAASRPPRREEPTTESHGDWLKRNVAMFSKWSDEQRRQAYKAVMEELGMEKVSSMEDAKRVHKGMADAYYTEFPPEGDEAPF